MLGRIRRLERDGDVKGLADGLRSDSWLVRVAAVNALSECRGAVAEDALLQALSDRHTVVRQSAARSLAHVNPTLSPERVLVAVRPDALTHPLSASEIVHFGLWQIPSVETFETLASALEEAADVDRAIYIDVLGQLADKRSFSVIATYVDDPHPITRLTAVESLGHLRDDRAVPTLATKADDPDRRVAEAAVSALEEIGQSSRNALEQLCQTSHSRIVRRRAKRALRRIAD